MRNVFMAEEDKPSIFQVSCHRRLYPFVNGSIEVVFVDDVVLSLMLVRCALHILLQFILFLIPLFAALLILLMLNCMFYMHEY